MNTDIIPQEPPEEEILFGGNLAEPQRQPAQPQPQHQPQPKPRPIKKVADPKAAMAALKMIVAQGERDGERREATRGQGLDAALAKQMQECEDPIVAPPKYCVRGAWEIACLDLPPLEKIWNGIALSPFAIYGVAGAPGRGKSRVTFDLARQQVLGRDFFGLPTLQRPLKWLIAGSENDIHRLNFEMCRFLFHADPAVMAGKSARERMQIAAANGFGEQDIQRLDSFIRPFTLEQPDDCYISLGDEDNQRKLTQTLEAEAPDVIVIDPWGDLIAGEELNDADVRGTIQILRQCEKAAKINAPCFVVCHARIGANEEAKARGTDEGNFMKNSKCLYSIARYFINVRRASFDDNPPIELVCSKNNNGEKPPPVAGRLNPETMSYEVLADHDPEAWQRELENYARTQSGRGGASVKQQMLDIEAEVSAALDTARKEAESRGERFKGLPKGDLCLAVQAAFSLRNITITEKRFRVALAALVKNKPLEFSVSAPHDKRREYVGTPGEIVWVAEAKQARTPFDE